MTKPKAYVRYSESSDAGGDGGFHWMRLRGVDVAYLRYHATILRKYNAFGIRRDIVRACRKRSISIIVFHNLNDGVTRATTTRRLRRHGIIDSLGGKGKRYYLDINEWDEFVTLEPEWSNNTLHVSEL